MYLKKLEIAGFKSFAEKADFNFSPGIAAAVGPNGCGKSNIVDAIRWVLGSQSPRMLRGAQMDELIFSGTEKRRPMNYAEVSMTLADTEDYLPLDYNEVKITRRMYRSGEGEYYINKNPCRLRDIVELFLDTGIGTETYSLIGQGRVEQLINARPEDHRELFEEAARIHKYRRKKKETLSRLEEANQNLLRVEDLCQELQNQQEPLAEAAAQARLYSSLRDRLHEVELKIIARQWTDNIKRRAKVETEQRRIGTTMQEVKKEHEALQLRSDDEARQERVEKERLEKEQALQQEKEKQLQQLESRLAVVREQKRFSQEKSGFKENALQEVWERIAGLDKTLEQNGIELEKLAHEQLEQEEKATALKEKLQQLQDEQELPALDDMRKRMDEVGSRLTTLKQSMEDKETRRNELKEIIDELSGRLDKSREQQQAVVKREKEYSALQERLHWEEEQWSREQSYFKQRRRELEQQLESAGSELKAMEQEQDKKNNRVKFLQENEENLSYYAAGVKAVMQAAAGKEALTGIHGPVANLIAVPPDLEKSVEVALGGAMQFIVTNDDQAAQEAIEFLKKGRSGRATFLPLNMLRPPARREVPVLAEKGLLGVASKLVQAPEHFRKVVDHLLGGVLITQDLKTALKIARANKSGWKLVTLDGEVINPGGSMTGGYQPRDNVGILQRRRELADLKDELASRRQDMDRARNVIADLKKELTQIIQKLTDGETAGKEIEKRKLKLQGERENVQRELKGLTEELQRLKEEQSKWEGKQVLLTEELSAGRKEQEQLETELANLRVEENRLGEQLRQSEAAFRTAENELVELRVRYSAIQEKESSLQEQQSRHQQEKDGLQNLAAELVREKEKLLGECERLAAEEKDLTGKVREEELEYEKQKKLLVDLAAAVEKLGQKKQELTGKLENSEKEMDKLLRRSQQFELENVKLGEAGRYLEEQLREKFALEPDQDQSKLEELASAAGSPDDLAAQREKLAGEIGAMGVVNTAVIGEYERLQERIEFLQEQRQDLLEGEKGIKKVLAELDQYMKEKFMETLEVLEEYFNDVFQRLFGGGKALLSLTDPDDVLESGIEIIAQPPGKNLKNISLLSGGEKALTAIALLFALLKYRPVPFCILDEIDSSLDDSNAGRFINMLKGFAVDTQFILITHRRRTMEEADLLYGVTMEEEGISKVISLDMKQKAG